MDADCPGKVSAESVVGCPEDPQPDPVPRERPLRHSGVVARKTLTPTLSRGEREEERPQL